MSYLGPDVTERPYFFVLPSGHVSPLRLPTLAGLVEVLQRQEAGTRGYRRGCYGPVAEVCRHSRVRLFTDVPQVAPPRRVSHREHPPTRKDG